MRSFADVRDYLYGLKHRGANYGIDRMQRFVVRLGNPHSGYPVIHVAGTNGKGSTCALLEAVYRAAGYRTGMFTSPHLVYQGERVQVDREILCRDAIVDYARRLRPIAEAIEADEPGLHPTFFEFMTGMALLRFAEAKVDIAIIETGLGGRLDATNVVEPVLSVITSIGMDHTEILGDTYAAIAAEKAGIIKTGRPVVIGLLPAEAEAVIRNIAAERNSPVYSVRESYGSDLSRFPCCALPGDYQRINAATALLAVDLLKPTFPVTDFATASGLASVRWAGRWDARSLPCGTLILDASHNAEGIAFLEQNLHDLVARNGRKPTIIAGTLGQQRATALMPVLARYAAALYLLVPQQSRACSHAELRAALPADCTCPVHDATLKDLFPAPQICTLCSSPLDTVVATGSIYLIGEIMDALQQLQPVGDAILQD